MDWVGSFFWTFPHWVGFGITAAVSLFCFFGFMSDAVNTDQTRASRRRDARYSLASFFIGVPVSLIWFIAIPVGLVAGLVYGMSRLVKIAEFGKADA